MNADALAGRIAALHPHGRIYPEALLIDGRAVPLNPSGCQTCLTSWPCPTMTEVLATGVNGGVDISLPSNGADDAPKKPKGAAANGPCSGGTPLFNHPAHRQELKP